MLATVPDLLRLVAVPVLGWAAWRDVKTRRVPNRTWLPLFALGALLLLWDGYLAWAGGNALFFVKVALSLGFVVPLATAFWWTGSFGGADAKAFYAIALLFPVNPVYYTAELGLPVDALPLTVQGAAVFSLAVLSNTVIVGVAYPVAVALGNLLRGHLAWPMLIGRPVAWDDVDEEYGLLLETPEGYTRRGLDLDALRMYLAWRGASLADLRAAPEEFRDPDSLPAEPNPPGDGGLASDGGDPTTDAVATESDAASTETDAGGDDVTPTESNADGTDADATETDADATDALPPAADDEWGAAAFLAHIEGSAYGTSPDQLRDGLAVLAEEDVVWISPGIPFLVPTFVGLLVALVYGNLLVTALLALGLY